MSGARAVPGGDRGPPDEADELIDAGVRGGRTQLAAVA